MHLKRHEKTHTHKGEKPFAGPRAGCDRRYGSREALRKHLNIHEKKFCCARCGKAFGVPADLEDHRVNVTNCAARRGRHDK